MTNNWRNEDKELGMERTKYWRNEDKKLGRRGLGIGEKRIKIKEL
jgi:hypothetical protein